MADKETDKPDSQPVTFFQTLSRAALEQELIERASRRFSTKALRAALFPKHLGTMEQPDGYAGTQGECGDLMTFYLRVEEGRVSKITFTTDGCDATIASGEMLSTLVTGLTLDQAARLTPQALLDALDGLPPNHVHCAHLAVKTLREAIADHRHRRRG